MSRAAALKNLIAEVGKALKGKGRLPAEKGLDETMPVVKDRGPQSIDQEPLPEALPEGLQGGTQLAPNPEPPAPVEQPKPEIPEGGNPNTPMTTTPLTEGDGRAVIEAAGTAPAELDYSNLNRARIQTDEDVGGVVDELIRIKKTQGEEIGPRETFEGVRERAKGLKWRDITEKANSKTPLNIEEMRYAREVEADLLNDLQSDALDLKEKLNRGELSPEEEFQFRQRAAKVAAISRYIAGEKRRTAQLLASLRDTAGNDFLRGIQRDEFLANMNGYGSTTKIDNYLGDIINANTVDQAVKAADPYRPVKLAGRFLSNVWFNQVLSKFAVAKAGIGGLVLNKGLFPYEKWLASRISLASRHLEDRSHLPAHNREVRQGEALVEMLGFFQSLRDAAGPIVKHLKDPEYNLGKTMFGGDDTLTTNLARKDQSPVVNTLAQIADFVTQNGSRRLLTLTDMVVKSMSFQQKTKAFAYRVATNEGITDPDELAKRMNELIKDMDDEMFEQAFLAGQDATLTQRLSSVSEGLTKGIQKVPFLKFFAPFTRTMLAGTELALERMPGVGMMMPRTRAAFETGGAARDEALAKQLLGMQLIGLGAYMGMNGEAYSGAMLSKDEQYARMKDGTYPNSIVTENGSFQIMFLSPLHEILFVGVMLGETYNFVNEELTPDDPRYKSNLEMLLTAAPAAAWTFVETTLTTSVGRNIRELLQAMDDPARYGEKKTVNTVAPMFGVWGQGLVRRGIDPTRRRQPKGETVFEDLMSAIKNNTPGLSDELPPAVGLLGEERPPYSMTDLFNWSPAPQHAEIWDMLQRNNVNLRLPRPEVSLPAGQSLGIPFHLDRDLNPDDFTDEFKEENPEATKKGYPYYLYSTIRGETYVTALSELAKSEEFLALPEGDANNDDAVYTQGDAIDRVVRQANSYAKEQFIGILSSGMKDYEGKMREMIDRPQERKGFVTPATEKAVEKIRAEQTNARF